MFSLARCLCSLDATSCALLSEDFPGTTRWHFQRELVACHSRACLGGAGAASQQQHVAVVTACAGRAGVALHPTSEAAALQATLDGVQPNGAGNLVVALKLALVSDANTC